MSKEPLLDFIIDSIEQIKYEFKGIKSSDDFLRDREGIMKLDAISMRLQAIGETIKTIHKQEEDFLKEFAPQEYWDMIIRMRDVISHHYINIDAEIVFEVCQEELEQLEDTIKKIKMQIEKE